MENDQKHKETKKLRAAAVEALELALDGWANVDEYTWERGDYDERVRSITKAIK